MPRRHDYWTRQVFVAHAPLYQAVLERAKGSAGSDARGIRRILSRYGVRPPARVLDIACGIGRHVVPLAQMGYSMIGNDFSPAYLEEARAYAAREGLPPGRARFLRSDYRRVDRALRRERLAPVDAALSIFTSMGHYGERGDLTTLRAVRRVVRPGGLFLMEMSNRDWILSHFQPKGTMEGERGVLIREARRFDWDSSTSVAQWTFYQGAPGRRRKVFEQEVRVKLYSIHELKRLFELAGWEHVQSFGGLAGRPVGSDTPRLALLARRPRN